MIQYFPSITLMRVFGGHSSYGAETTSQPLIKPWSHFNGSMLVGFELKPPTFSFELKVLQNERMIQRSLPETNQAMLTNPSVLVCGMGLKHYDTGIFKIIVRVPIPQRQLNMHGLTFF